MMILFYHDFIEPMPLCQIEVLGPQIAADAGVLQELIGLVLLYTEAGRQTAPEFLAAAGKTGFDYPEE